MSDLAFSSYDCDCQRLALALASSDAMTWVMTGDSITHGLVHTQGRRSYTEHLHEIIRGELGRGRDAIINSAISGNRIADILNDWARRVSSWNPDVVALMIGTNDLATDGRYLAAPEYMASLREFVVRTRAIGALPVLQTPPPIDVLNAPTRSRITEFVDAIRTVAAAEEAVLVDHHARFMDFGGGAVPWPLMNDPIHPNATGHALIAVELAQALGIRTAARTIASLEGQLKNVA